MIEEEAKSGVAELVVIAFEIVAAELVNDDDDHQFGMTVVGGCETVWAGKKNSGEACQNERERNRDAELKRLVIREGSLHSQANPPKWNE